MEMDIPALFETLSKPFVETTKQERRDAMQTATRLTEVWHQLDETPKSTAIEILSSFQQHPEPFHGIFINSLLFKLTDDTKYLKKLPQHFSNYDPDVQEGASTFMAISAYRFQAKPEDTHIEEIFSRSIQRDLFLKQLQKVQILYDAVATNGNSTFERNNRVVILTGQFLHPPHAPTVDALNYARTLITEYDKDVLIICSSQISYGVDGAVAPTYMASRAHDLVGRRQVLYEGIQIPFLLCGDGVFNEASIAQGLATIDAFQPEMILSISSPALLAEPFHDRSFCFIYPTGNAPAHTKNCYFHTYQTPNQATQQLLKEENILDKLLFSQPYDLKLKPPSDSLTRAEFGIPEDAFVFVVVGMRLHTEVDHNFLTMLEDIVSHPKAHIVFAGYFNNYKAKLAPHEKLTDRNTWIGFQNDIMAVHNISDVFLNPNRSGGGTGVVYAMQAELPILSQKVGDGGVVADAFPTLKNYQHMGETAITLIDDEGLLGQYRAISKAQAPKFSGRDKLIKRIMIEFEKFAENHPSNTAEAGD